MTEKYVVEGDVAILYSPGYGAGWSTWGDKELAYDKDLVGAYMQGGVDKLAEVTLKKYPGTYLGGISDIEVEWVAQGTRFRINEYDGSESVELLGSSYDSFTVA